MNEFLTYYKEEKASLEKMIEEYNNNLLNEKDSYLKDNLAIFAKLNSKGKRIRGILVNLGYKIKKEKSTYSYPLALAYEVFQTSILVHDDIIDQDDLRRDEKTIHYYNKEKYQDKSSLKEVEHFSNSIALCMGDYGLFLANQIIASSYSQDNNLSKVLTYFNETVLNTIKGELLDVILPFEDKYIGISKSILEEKILDIYRLKTSHYTITGPLLIGMILSGAEDEEIESIKEFGEKVGIAFQIQDDILGLYSNEIGKVQSSDIKEGKETLLYAYTKNTPYSEELDKYYGKDIKDQSIIEKVKDIIEKSNALEKATNLMNSLYDESIIMVDNMNFIKEEDKIILKGFVEYLRNRRK